MLPFQGLPCPTNTSRIAWNLPFSGDRKKSTKINFLGPETAGWGGGLPREGVVVEKFVPSLESLSSFQKNPRAHKNQIGTSPPKTQNTPTPLPPKKEEFYGHGGFPAESPGAHKIGARIAFSAPELRTKNFTDMRHFLAKGGSFDQGFSSKITFRGFCGSRGFLYCGQKIFTDMRIFLILGFPEPQNSQSDYFICLKLSGRLFFSPFSLMKSVWWSWASGYQTNLSLCFVGKLLPD